MFKKIIFFLTIFIQLFYLTVPAAVLAQDASFNLKQPEGFGIKAPFKNSNDPNAENLLETIILNVITLFFTVGGVGAIIYFVWGSVDWILSGGDKEKIAGARKKMTNALIGLALLSLSFVIINWIGLIIGFNPLGNLQIRGLGDNPTTGSQPVPN